MLGLAGNQNQKWGVGTLVCLVNLDFGHLDPTLGVAGRVTAIYRFMWELRVTSGPR